MDAVTTLPYSTANTKGQCIRHPSIQLKQKKTFGSGYKTITSICPMCAMELMSIEGNDNDDDCGGRDVGHVENEVVSSSTSVGWDASSIHASAQRSNSSTRTTQQQQHHRSSRSRYSKQRFADDVSIKSAPSTYNREPSHRQQQHEFRTNNNLESASSFGQSSRSCGSHRHRPSSTANNKQYYSHEISPCDSSSSTFDMSLSVSSRSLSSRSSSSQGGGSSRRSISSSSSAASYTSSHSGQSRRSNNSNRRPKQQEQEYVCGLQYNNGYYTGQIDIGTNLPHGLGSLRDRQGAICNEGQWYYGRLVESTLPPSRTAASYDPRWHAYTQQQQQEKTNNFERYIVSSSEEDESTSSACSTVHTDDNDDSSIPSVALSSQSSSSSSWSSIHRHSSSSSSSTTTRRLHPPSSPKYSAKESKNTMPSLVPQDKLRSFSRTSTQASRTSSVATTKVSVPQAATGDQVTYNKLQEYQNYIDMCDDNEDWYLNQEHGGKSRRVRFREE